MTVLELEGKNNIFGNNELVHKGLKSIMYSYVTVCDVIIQNATDLYGANEQQQWTG